MQKSYRNILLGILLLNFGACQPPPNERPHIVLILVDDLGKEWVSCYGAEDIATPQVDALAARGMRFNTVYSMPQCTPTRVTLLTGQYPFRHGWVNHWDVPRWGGGAHFDETQNPSLGIALKQAGYATCIAGKWQIDDFRVEPDALTRQGFDSYCMWTGYETGVEASAERYQDPYIFTSTGSSTYSGEFGPDIFAHHIQGFIETHHDQPLFIYYPMVLTHPPLVPTPDESATTPMEKHKAMVRYADKLTGAIVASLEQAGILDNTLLIWTTDNGTSRGLWGNYNGRRIEGGKAKTLEPGISAPFIAHWPAKILPGTVSNALVDFTDFLPTFTELAEVDPQNIWPHHTFDGHSFVSALKGDPSNVSRSWILSMGGGNDARLTGEGVENQYRFRDRVVRNDRYKLYIDAQKRASHFYDLERDPFEEINLLDSLTTEEQVAQFEYLSSLIATFPDQDADPHYLPNPPQPWDVKISAESQTWKK